MKKVMGTYSCCLARASAQTLSVIKTSTILDGKGHILKDKSDRDQRNTHWSILNGRGNTDLRLERPDGHAWMDRHTCASWMALQ